MRSYFRSVFALVTVLLIGACASGAHTGSYAPGCMAMAGDTIELDHSRFVWDKFTDEVKVDASGNVTDAFPAHPVRGSYQIQGDKLVLKPDADGVTSIFYMLNDGGNHYVMNVVQHSEWQATGAIPACALVLDDNAKS